MRTTRPILCLTLLAALLWPGAALAGDRSDPRNRASLQVEAVREVENDWASARLSVFAEGKSAAMVASQVNAAMARVVARARKAKDVDRRTGGYTTQPIYDDGRVVRWRGSQELRLESGNADRLAELVGALQADDVLLVGIQFSVRRETRRKLEDELIAEALAAFRDRADLIAKGMGAKAWSLIDVSVGTTSHGPQPVMRMEARSSYSLLGSSPPTFEAGTSEVRVQANGVVELD